MKNANRITPFPFGRPVMGLRRGMGDDTSDDGSDDGGDDSGFDSSSIDSLSGLLDDTSGSVDGVDLSSIQNYATQAGNSSSSSSTLGSITNFLTSNGINLGSVANVLTTALAQPGNTAAQTAYLQQELAYANQLQQTQAKTSSSTVMFVLIGAVGVYLLTRNRN